MCNKAFYIVKPEVFSKRSEIKDYIEKKTGLTIVYSRILELNQHDVNSLYLDDIGSDLLPCIIRQLSGSVIDAGILEGDGALEKFTRICGLDPNPEKCAPESVRYKWGLRKPKIYYGRIYYLNAIHKASNKELSPSIEWLFKKEGAE